MVRVRLNFFAGGGKLDKHAPCVMLWGPFHCSASTADVLSLEDLLYQTPRPQGWAEVRPGELVGEGQSFSLGRVDCQRWLPMAGHSCWVTTPS